MQTIKTQKAGLSQRVTSQWEARNFGLTGIFHIKEWSHIEFEWFHSFY